MVTGDRGIPLLVFLFRESELGAGNGLDECVIPTENSNSADNILFSLGNLDCRRSRALEHQTETMCAVIHLLSCQGFGKGADT